MHAGEQRFHIRFVPGRGQEVDGVQVTVDLIERGGDIGARRAVGVTELQAEARLAAKNELMQLPARESEMCGMPFRWLSAAANFMNSLGTCRRCTQGLVPAHGHDPG